MTPVAPAARTPGRPRVVLYNPRAEFYTMPLALLAIASHLDRDRYDVVIVDARVEADPHAALTAALEGALCLGITVLTGPPIHDAIAASRIAKRMHAGLAVIWGGWHPSIFPRQCLDEPSVDAAVQGQGEVTFAEIVDRLAAGGTLDGCPGTTVRGADGVPIMHAARPLSPLDALAAHDYSLIDVERYFTLKGKRQLDYISSQGCRFRCAFCADPFVYERQWVALAPARVVSEIATLWQRHRFDDVNFQDETFFTSCGRVEAIANGLIAAGLPMTWAATMRADQGARLPDEVMARCKASGLRRVLIGVESGDEATLELIRKDTTLDEVFASAEKIRRHGISGRFPFIVGFPGESEESARASIRAAGRLRHMSPSFETVFFYFKPYPGTELARRAERDGYAGASTLGGWADFDFVDGQAGPWVSEAVYRMVERFKHDTREARSGHGTPKAHRAEAG